MLTLLLIGAVKGALVLALAFVLTRLLRHRSAAARHLTWCTALFAAALLPIATATLPEWKVAVPQALVAPTIIQAEEPALVVVSKPTQPVERVAIPEPTLRPEPATTVSRPMSPTTMALAVWGLIALLMIGALGVSLIRLARLTRKAATVSDPSMNGLVAQLSPQRVRLLLSDRIDVPLTWGVRRPVVLLPAAATTWSRERWEAVLRHEMAHVERRDTLIQLFARISCAVYWFNPLMWLAERSLERERERACDDRVLAAGTRASGYAGELLDIAVASTSTRYAGAALAMARRGELEGRLLSILDPKVRRTVPGTLAAVSVGVLALVLALPLAALQPGRGVRVLPPPPPRAPQQQAPASPKSPPAPARSPAPGRPSAPSPAAVPPRPSAPSPASVPPKPGDPTPPPAAAVPPPPALPPGRVASFAQQVGQFCSESKSSHLSRNVNDSGDKTWRVTWTGDNCSVDLRARGDINFTADFKDIGLELKRGSSLEITVRNGSSVRRLEMSSVGGSRLVWTVNGKEEPFDDAAQRWLSDFLIELERHTAFAVETRLPALLQKGGPDAVLDEIDHMASDYSHAMYSIGLLEKAKLSPAQVRRLAHAAGQRIDSDYELGRVFKQIASRYSLDDDALRAEFIAGAGTLQSDYERAMLLLTLVEKGAVSPAAGPTVVRLTTAMSSDYERARVLMALGESKMVDPKTVAPEYLSAVSSMKSDYERGRVLKLLASAGTLGREALIRLLDTTASMDSDYEAANVLVAVAGNNVVDGDVKSAFLRAAGRLRSDYEKNRATSALVKP